ncbi:hypothetical protein ABPG75_004242 [Micractinium tetrahymenae]
MRQWQGGGAGPARAALALAALCSLLATAHAGVMAVGKLQSCVNDGSTPSTSLSCSQKIVVTVELENNKIYETEQLNFGVSCVNSPTDTCPCPCNYATDPTCPCRDLKENITVAATKSAVYARYPLTFYKYMNGRPFEDIIIGSRCSDDWFDAGATCGFAKDANNQDIMDSQGFCCGCPFFNLGGSAGITRANLDCGLFNIKKSAHCLRWDDNWWFIGFTIGEYMMDFRVNLDITTRSTNATTNVTTTSKEVLEVTPVQPFQRDSSRRLSAKLLGDLEAYQQAPQLDGKYLFIPWKNGEGPQEAYTRHFEEWMVVDPAMVTTTGLECDKIGVSYSGFRNSQPNACSTPAGSCIKNQLVDLWNEDMSRIYLQGKTPMYMVGRYGGGADNYRNQLNATLNSRGSLDFFLSFPITAIKTSLMTLTVAADSVQFVVSRSPAAIESVQVCTFDGKFCGGFESLATRGYLLVDVKNTGYVAADFTVTVVNCTAGIRPIVAQRAGIMSQSSRRFQFEIYMETDQATNSSCSVLVKDSLGDSAASQAFSFYTNATDYGTVPDQSDLGGKVTGPGNGTSSESEWCKTVCPNVFDVKCAAVKGCAAQLAKGIAAIVGPAVGLGILLMAWRSGYLSLLFRLLSLLFCRPAAPAAAAPAQPVKPKGAGRRRAASGASVEEEGDEAGMSPRIRAGRPGDRGQEQAAHSPLQQWWGQARRRGSGASSSSSSDASVIVVRPPAAKHLPAASEPPAAGQRGRASSFARARASFYAAAQQARDMMAGLRNFMFTNPLAVAAPKPTGYPPLPQPQYMAAALPAVAFAAPAGYPAPYPTSPLLPPQQQQFQTAAGGWPTPAALAAPGSPMLALPPPGGMMPPAAYSPPMLTPPPARTLLLPPAPVQQQQMMMMMQPQPQQQQQQMVPPPPPQQQRMMMMPQQPQPRVEHMGPAMVPAMGPPVNAPLAPPSAGASGAPASGRSAAAVADMQRRLQQVQQQVLLLQQARQQGLAQPAGSVPPLPPAAQPGSPSLAPLRPGLPGIQPLHRPS